MLYRRGLGPARQHVGSLGRRPFQNGICRECDGHAGHTHALASVSPEKGGIAKPGISQSEFGFGKVRGRACFYRIDTCGCCSSCLCIDREEERRRKGNGPGQSGMLSMILITHPCEKNHRKDGVRTVIAMERQSWSQNQASHSEKHRGDFFRSDEWTLRDSRAAQRLRPLRGRCGRRGFQASGSPDRASPGQSPAKA